MVVVTGATGHIGNNLVRALLQRGRRVRALVHGQPLGLEDLPVEIARGDVRDPESLRAAFSGAEVVYHLAARIAIVSSEEPAVRAVNVEGTRNVVRACRAAGVRRLIHFSSIHALSGLPRDRPVDETRAAAGPDAPAYDRSKADGEALVRAAVGEGLDAVIVNPTGVIGPHDRRPSHMGQFLCALGRRRAPAVVEGGFNWVDVRDVVAGALGAEERGRRGERYLLSGHWRSARDLARVAAEALGVPPPRIVVPMALARAVAPPVTLACQLLGRRPLFTRDALSALRSHRDVRSDRAAQELGFTARPFEDTIRDTCRWFREHGLV